VTRLLLDTTFLLDAERSGASLRAAIAPEDDVAIAAISVAELRVGALLASARTAAARSAFVEEVIVAVPVVAYDVRVAESHARLLMEVQRQGTPRGAHDLLIAATAAATGRAVVTADATAFVGLPGVEVHHHR
jgi:tRNA(fMet)-specific endonuclease VapC